MDKLWTADQQNAIDTRGGSVLVSAAAGSGKTAVLVERVIGKITDSEHPCDIDKLLIVTFTNLAADEMKSRIGAGLSDLIRKKPSSHLRKQQALLGRANISTINSFCTRLIREHFQQANLSVDFSVADEREIAAIKLESAVKAIEQCIAEDDSGAFETLNNLVDIRGEKGLIDTVLRLYDFIRSHPFPEKFVHSKLDMYKTDIDPVDSEWGQVIINYTDKAVAYAISLLENAYELARSDDDMFSAYGAGIETNLNTVKSLAESVGSMGWDGICAAIHSATFVKIGRLTKYPDEQFKKQVTTLHGDAKKIINTLSDNIYIVNSQYFKSDIEYLYDSFKLMFYIVSVFEKIYNDAKSEKNIIDFSDAEQYALKLLVNSVDGGAEKTALAKEISGQFEEILIDEYQDVNEAQDTIFKALSNDEQNMFSVGDVKQSIYRFRLAMPEIFLRKKKEFTVYDGVNYPATINLDKNFRSKRSVINFVNFVFERLMCDESISEIKYTGREPLKYGANYSSESPVQLHILEDENSLSEDSIQIQAEFVAKKIKDMLNSGYTVTKNDEQVAVQPKDICILLRSHRHQSSVYEKELGRHGVPASSVASKNLFECSEVVPLISLLKVICNPRLDISLVSALMSPLWGFTADEIADIKLHSAGDGLYSAMTGCSENEKIKGFLYDFAKLRELSSSVGVSLLIEKIVEDKLYEQVISMGDGGDVCRTNLHLLLDFAREREERGAGRLSDFVRYVNMLEKYGTAPGAAVSVSGGQNSVKILSFHSSKGLEFPVCFVSDISKKINKMDSIQNILLHKELGFASKCIDEQTMQKFSTMPYIALKIETDRATVAEELRLLYVAMTRAREQLILVGSCKKTDSLEKILATHQHSDSGFWLYSCGSYLDMLIRSLSEKICFDNADNAQGQAIAINDTNFEFFVHREYTEEKNDKLQSVIDNTECGPLQANSENVCLLKEIFEWKYPYSESTKTPSKLTVSEISKRSGDYLFENKPQFARGPKTKAVDKGNAMHKLMQVCDINRLCENSDKEILRLEQMGILSELENKLIDRVNVDKFIKSDIAKIMCSTDKLLREKQFMMQVDIGLLRENGKSLPSGDTVMVQGVIDCLCVDKDGRATVVEYKTDRVKNAQTLVLRYKKQVDLYAKAVKKELGYEVCGKYIYSFSLGRAIEMK